VASEHPTEKKCSKSVFLKAFQASKKDGLSMSPQPFIGGAFDV